MTHQSRALLTESTPTAGDGIQRPQNCGCHQARHLCERSASVGVLGPGLAPTVPLLTKPHMVFKIRDRRQASALGLTFGVGSPPGQAVHTAVLPRWGFWGVLGANCVVTVVVWGVVALLVTRVLKRQR